MDPSLPPSTDDFSYSNPPLSFHTQDPNSSPPTPPPDASSQIPQTDPSQMPFLPPPFRPGSGIDPSITSTPRGSAAFGTSQGFNPYGTPRSQPSALNASNNSVPLLSGPAVTTGALPTKERYGDVSGNTDDYLRRKYTPWYKRPLVWVLALGALAVIVVAVVVPVYFTVIKPNNRSVNGAATAPGATPTKSGGGGGGGGSTTKAVTGADGSTVTKEDGSTFVYHNQFGGFCQLLSPLSLLEKGC